MIHMSKIPGTLHKMLGSMSQETTDTPPGIWGLGVLGLPIFYKHVTPLVLRNNNTYYVLFIVFYVDLRYT